MVGLLVVAEGAQELNIGIGKEERRGKERRGEERRGQGVCIVHCQLQAFHTRKGFNAWAVNPLVGLPQPAGWSSSALHSMSRSEEELSA